MSFDTLGLSDKILSAIAAAGFEKPTPIQEQAIPHALQGRDVLGIAQTGTGKTAAFTLPMLNRLEKGRARARMPRTLILEPTRELAAQVEESFEIIGQNHKLNLALLIGGVSFADQNRILDRGADVLIATPGRLLDHIERGKLLLTGVEILVIDEADRMLDMGFIPDVERICKLIPFTRQTLFFSATMPSEIQRLVDTFLHNPVRVEVAPPATAASTVEQRIISAPKEAADKRAALRDLIRSEADLTNGIVFCNRKRDVDIVNKSLRKHGFNAACLHGDMDQRSRMKTLEQFKSGEIALLVASDVAARGLDIPNVSHVLNYDVPIHAEDYIHRIGRTGRAGRSGKAIMLATKADKKYVDAISQLTGTIIAPGDGQKDPLVGDAGKPRTRSAGKKPEQNNQRKVATSSPTTDATTAPRNQNKDESDSKISSSDNRAKRPSGRRDASDTKKVVGLGDHMPAFLARPVRPGIK
jgi:superfamily II DNA/RNA helicase